MGTSSGMLHPLEETLTTHKAAFHINFPRYTFLTRYSTAFPGHTYIYLFGSTISNFSGKMEFRGIPHLRIIALPKIVCCLDEDNKYGDGVPTNADDTVLDFHHISSVGVLEGCNVLYFVTVYI